MQSAPQIDLPGPSAMTARSDPAVDLQDMRLAGVIRDDELDEKMSADAEAPDQQSDDVA